MIRTAPPDPSYDCHGWVFTGERYVIHGKDVEWILRDNRYELVQSPSPGDLAIYRDRAGRIAHSGLVVATRSGAAPLIESKWGYIGRYVSPADTRMYGAGGTYYHSKRSGHHIPVAVGECNDKWPDGPSSSE